MRLTTLDVPILGSAGSSPLGLNHMVYQGQAHMLTIGLGGSGKTNAVVFPNLICRRCSKFTFDVIDGQITKATALHCQHVLGQEVWVLDAMGVMPLNRMPTFNGKPAYLRFNPILIIARSKNPVIVATTLAKAAVTISGHDTHWPEGAQMTFSSFCLHVAFDPKFDEDERTMKTVWDLITTAHLFDETIATMRCSNQVFLRDVANAYDDLPDEDREMRSILSNLRVQLGAIMADHGLMDAMCGETVDFKQMNKRSIAIFAVAPGMHSDATMRFYKLLVSVVLMEIETAGIREWDSDQPMILGMLDEFNSLGDFPQLVGAMARGRNFGFQAHCLVQSLGQTADTHKNTYRSLMGLMGVVQYFGGTADEFTANEISRLSGDRTIIAPSVSYSHGGREGHSESYSLTKQRVYTPDQVMRLPLPKQLVSYTGVGMAEGTLYQYGMKDFPDYLMFMNAIKRGMKPEDAGAMVRLFQAEQAQDFARRAAQYDAHLAQSYQRPAPPRRSPIGWGRLIDRGFAALFGDDTDF